MEGTEEIKIQLTNLVTDAARKLGVEKYSMNLNLNAFKGDGFLGEFYKLSILDEECNTFYHLAIKKAPADESSRQENSIEKVYQNEIFFYSEIYPVLRKFEEEYRVTEPFNAIPEYITSCSDIGNEALVFKDITKSGYILREKDLLLNHEHVKLIFETYGHFHSLSFCLKEKKPDEFQKLTKPLHNIWHEMISKQTFLNVLTKILQKALESLDSSKDKLILEKFRKYVDNTEEICNNSSNYQGKYFGILHGDCWSNNMMFKYKNDYDYTKPENINLLDFQLALTGTPIHDLSYFFYTGGSKKLFDNLEGYLDIYYDSFSKSAKQLGCDPNEILPREVLTYEWKIYARFGMMLSAILTKIKLMSKEDSIEMIESVGKEGYDQSAAFMEIPYDEKLFLERVRDILVHMHEIDAL